MSRLRDEASYLLRRGATVVIDTAAAAGLLPPPVRLPSAGQLTMSDIIITTPAEAQAAVRDIDDRLTVIERRQALLISSVSNLRDSLPLTVDKVKALIRTVKYLASIHMPDNGADLLNRGGGHVRKDQARTDILDMEEE